MLKLKHSKKNSLEIESNEWERILKNYEDAVNILKTIKHVADEHPEYLPIFTSLMSHFQPIGNNLTVMMNIVKIASWRQQQLKK